MTTQHKKKKGSPVFGIALDDVLVTYSQEPNSLPILVTELTSFLKRYGTSDISVVLPVCKRLSSLISLFLLLQSSNQRRSDAPVSFSLSLRSRSWL